MAVPFQVAAVLCALGIELVRVGTTDQRGQRAAAKDLVGARQETTEERRGVREVVARECEDPRAVVRILRLEPRGELRAEIILRVAREVSAEIALRIVAREGELGNGGNALCTVRQDRVENRGVWDATFRALLGG